MKGICGNCGKVCEDEYRLVLMARNASLMLWLNLCAECTERLACSFMERNARIASVGLRVLERSKEGP